MLPQFFKIICVNNSGQTVTFTPGLINLKITFWHIDPDTGKIVYTQRGDDDMDFDTGRSVVDGAEIMDDSSLLATTEIDNITGDVEFLGAQIQLEVTHDEGLAVVANGTFDLYLDGGDASGELASDASGYGSAEINFLENIGSMIIDPASTDDQVTRSQVFNI